MSALAATRHKNLAERANDNAPYASRHEVLSCADVVNSNTGRALLELNEWAESCTARDRLRRDTERFADILEREGVQARLPVEMVAIGSATGQIDALDTYRNSNILPLVASRNRRSLIRDLKWFLANHPKGAYARYGVITSGERVPVFGELRKRVQALHRKISKWASWAKKRYRILIQHRQGEFTVDENLSFHPHVNVIYWPTKPLKKADWSSFLKETEQFFGAYWRDCGKIEDVNEVVKYITKGDDLQLLADSACLVEAWRDCGVPRDEIHAQFVDRIGGKREGATPLELLADASICMRTVQTDLENAWRQGHSHPLVWLFHEMHCLHVAQSMGDFAGERRKLREGKLKIVSIWTPAGMKQRMVAKNSKMRSEQPPEIVENQVICISLPQPRFTPWSEPVIYVNGYNPRPVTSNGRGGLALINRLKAEVAPVWLANGAPVASVAVRRAIMVSGVMDEGLGGGVPRSGAAAQAEPVGAADGEAVYGSHQYENCPGSIRISLGHLGEYDPYTGEFFEKPPDRGKKYNEAGERLFETFDDVLNHFFDMEEN